MRRLMRGREKLAFLTDFDYVLPPWTYTTLPSINSNAPWQLRNESKY